MTSRDHRQLRRQVRHLHGRAGWLPAAAMVVLLATCSADDGIDGDASGTVAPTETTTTDTIPPSTTSAPDVTSPPDTANAPPSMPAQQGMPDCTGGTAVLDTTVLDSRLVVRESVDEMFWCIEDEQYGGQFGGIPTEGAVEPSLNTSGIYGRAFYQFHVPDDFPPSSRSTPRTATSSQPLAVAPVRTWS